jgi:hypothetical protein
MMIIWSAKQESVSFSFSRKCLVLHATSQAKRPVRQVEVSQLNHPVIYSDSPYQALQRTCGSARSATYVYQAGKIPQNVLASP